MFHPYIFNVIFIDNFFFQIIILLIKMARKFILVFILILFSGYILFAQNSYENFKVAVYARSYEVQKMENLEWLDSIWNIITQQVHVDKIYLETHRDLVIADQNTLNKVKEYFKENGIETAGGITYTIDESNRFQTFCYNNPEQRSKVQEIIEYTAKNFNEVILDDFFFTNCKCNLCIEAKGDRSWTEYRLQLMDEAARNLIVGPAKKVNPEVKVIIKYPNWYAHFQGLGFNLETEPEIFYGLYTGTETRDAVTSAQHLQPYLGYAIFRYFENLKPGFNMGGWVDTGGSRYLDRYAEQLWLTLFSKAPEITLFDFRQLQRPLGQFETATWQGTGTSFDVASMGKPVVVENKPVEPTTIARAAGYAFEQVDPYLSYLGNPVGIKCYRPYHSVGEDFLPNYLGMIGLPIDIVPEFPVEEKMVLLTESAKFDPEIVSKIKKQLLNGKSVTITSGLLNALQDKGIMDIAEIRFTGRKSLVNDFISGRQISQSVEKILIPQIQYLTNDSWEIASALDGPNGWPILHEAEYADGSLYVLTIPENFADLYQLPVPVLSKIRSIVAGHLRAQLEGAGNICLFLYDNNTMIVESFSDDPQDIRIAIDKEFTALTDLSNNKNLSGSIRGARGGWSEAREPEKLVFELNLKPHSFRIFKLAQ